MFGLSTVNLVIMWTGTGLLAVFLILFLVSLKHKNFFDPLSEDDYPLKEIYFIGYYIMEKTGYSYKSKKDRELRKELSVLYGEQYTEYYLRAVYAERVTFFIVLFLLGFVLYGLVNDITICIFLWALSFLAFYYFGIEPGNKVKRRSEDMMHDFTNVVSKLALFINAGMIMKEAWKEVANAEDTLIYQEMRIAVEEMKNGKSEGEALYTFGVRCMVPEIKKFTSTIVQGIQKGNAELSYMLQQQSKEVWNIKRQNIKRVGELAANKLMIPMFIMFAGILILVIVPVFTNMGV